VCALSMPMTSQALEADLALAFPNADIAIQDLAGDGDHYRARIVSSAFVGMSRVRRHQAVYAALKGKMGGELHALALETLTPEENEAV
jgi:Stress-induced morphogen (activity unknown)